MSSSWQGRLNQFDGDGFCSCMCVCMCVCVIYVHAASDRENDLVCARSEGGKILVFNIELREQPQKETAGDANDCLSTAA